MNRKHLVALLVVAVLAAGGVAYFHQSAPEDRAPTTADADKPRPTEVRFPSGAPQLSYIRVEAVVAHPEPLIDPLTARIAYDENHTARITTPIAGRVVKIHAQPGDTVAAGAPLVDIDAPDFGQAVADVSKAAADVNQKKSAQARVKELVEAGVAPRKDLEAADADLRQALAEQTRATARLNNYSGGRAANGHLALRAPIAGVVAERKVNPGSEVRGDLPDPLFVITDPTHLWVIVDLPERRLGVVRKGQSVTVEVDAYPGQAFPATVANIGEVVDPATRRVQVRCVLDNPRRLLKPEMYARVTPLANGESKLPRVPNSALITEGLYTFLFVETAPGVFAKRRVTPGLQGRTETYLKDGLREGERVVTGGALLLNSELAGS